MISFKIDYKLDSRCELSQYGYEKLLKEQSNGDIYDVKRGEVVDGGMVVEWSENKACLVDGLCIEDAMHKIERGYALAPTLKKWTKLSYDVLSNNE